MVPDPQGYLPIQRAAANGQIDVLRELVSSSGINSSGGGDNSSKNNNNSPAGSGACKVDLDATIPHSGKTVSVPAMSRTISPVG